MSLDADLLYCRFLAYPPGGRRTRHVGRPGRAYSPGKSTGSSVMQDNASNVIPARSEFSAQQAELAGRVARNTPAPGLNETCVPGLALRSEERRVGKECVSQCSSRWSPYH